jgi:ribonuclease HI
MKCDRPECNEPAIYMGLMPDSAPGYPKIALMCRASHTWCKLLDPAYEEWFQKVEQVYARAQMALRGLPAPPMPKVAVGSLVSELMATVAELVLDRGLVVQVDVEQPQKPAQASPEPDPIIIYTDGSCHPNPGPGGWGFVVTTPDGGVVESHSTVHQGDLTNNQAEYGGILAALAWARVNGIKKLTIKSDSELALKQIAGSYDTSDLKLVKLRDQVLALAAYFVIATFEWTPGATNLAHEYAEAAYRIAAERAGLKPSSKKGKDKRAE